MSKGQIYFFIIIVFVLSMLFGFKQPTEVCLALTFFSVFNFILELGKKIAIRSLTLMIATIQWIFGPYLSYNFLSAFDYYYMPVPREDYFSLAIPGISLFALGLYSVQDKYLNEQQLLDSLITYLKDKSGVGIYLIIAGFIFSYIGALLPASLAFFSYLLSNLKYVGAFYLLLSDRKDKAVYLTLVILFLVGDAMAMAMFHDLLLWLAFTLLLFALKYKPNLWLKLSALCCGTILIFTIQAIKGEYRSAVWLGTEDYNSKTELLENTISKRINTEEGLFSERNNAAFIYRINQGWIIGHVMAHTPQYEPFAGGETIMEGLYATLLPRFLAPDKAVSGGREYFEKYSGLELIGGTSMDLSPLGEAYANFATIGGAIFMFSLGLFYAAVLSYISKLSFNLPSLILWIPLLFQQAIKAESDITTGINHMSKAAVVIFLVYWVSKNIFKTKL